MGQPRISCAGWSSAATNDTAADMLSETVRLPKDDPEAIKYLAQQAAEASSEASTSAAVSADGASPAPAATTSNGTAASEPQTQPRPAPARPLGRGPVRKRPRQSLEAMSAALDAGKKMTTLEKVGTRALRG